MISNIILSPFSSITFSQATHVIIPLLWTIGSFSSPTMRCLLLLAFIHLHELQKKTKPTCYVPFLMTSLNKIKNSSWPWSSASGLLILCSQPAHNLTAHKVNANLSISGHWIKPGAQQQGLVLSAPFLLPKHRFSVPHPAEKPENHKVYVSLRAYLYNSNKSTL